MIYREILPPPVLSQFVRHFWYIEYYPKSNNVIDIPFRLMADGFPSLIFQYKNRFKGNKSFSAYPRSLLLGHTSNFRNLIIGGDFGVFGVALFPYTPALLFHMTSSDYSNSIIDIDNLCGLKNTCLEEKVILADSNKKRIRLLTNYLIEQLNSNTGYDLLIQDMVQSIIRFSGRQPIKMLMNGMTISRRQFERRFRDQVGLSPKTFSRIIHFQSCLQNPMPPEVTSLTGLALSKGYADQAHFCREFKTFSGINPKFYFKHLEDTAENLIHI